MGESMVSRKLMVGDARESKKVRGNDPGRKGIAGGGR